MLTRNNDLDRWGESGIVVGPPKQAGQRMRITFSHGEPDDLTYVQAAIDLDRAEVDRLRELCEEALKG